MPAKDIYHEAVKNALIKDGWTITADPYPLEYEDVELYPDLAVEKVISEEQKQRKIIIEIKSFISSSLMKDFELALGQYIRPLAKKIYAIIKNFHFQTKSVNS